MHATFFENGVAVSDAVWIQSTGRNDGEVDRSDFPNAVPGNIYEVRGNGTVRTAIVESINANGFGGTIYLKFI